MFRKRQLSDYESLTRPISPKFSNTSGLTTDPPPVSRINPEKARTSHRKDIKTEVNQEIRTIKTVTVLNSSPKTAKEEDEPVNKTDIANGQLRRLTFLRRGHALTYGALFLFTTILYARPAEFYPSTLTASVALIVGLLTLAIYFSTQLALEGTLSARPPEVNLISLFCLTGLLSIPLAINPTEAWLEFSGTFIRCIAIFIVMVNAVRSERRLKGLLVLSIAVSCWLSLGALNDYRLGLLTVEGYRVAGVGKGMFGNSNDMALYLVTMMPIAIGLIFAARGILRRVVFAVSVTLMIGAIVVTYSRGAFLGGLVALAFMGWKLGHNNRLTIFAVGTVVILLFLAVAPGNYGIRLLSIFVPSLDTVGSSSARQGELFRSIYVALRHPLLGIGMGNYAPEMSYRGLVTHNAYTQVAAEMGMAALACYTMFIVAPLKKLGQIARETVIERSQSHYYYLAVGLQASLLAYLVSSFFASVAYLWYVYYLVAYAVCLRRMYESETGRIVVIEKRKISKHGTGGIASITRIDGRTATT